jgi:hypothetical protein
MMSDLKDVLQEKGLLFVSHAMLSGGMFVTVDGGSTSVRVKWKGEELGLALSDRMKKYFTSDLYVSLVDKYKMSTITFFIQPQDDLVSEQDWSKAVNIFDVSF